MADKPKLPPRRPGPIRRYRTYPRSLREERGELTTEIPRGYPQPVARSTGVYNVPASASGQTGQNLPGIGVDVQSTYDIRPVNAKDFFIATVVRLVSDAAQPGSYDVQFTVPRGYVAVVREFSYQVGIVNVQSAPFVAKPFTPVADYATTGIQFFVDSIEQPYMLQASTANTNNILSFPVRGAPGMSRQKTHVLALQNSVVVFRVTTSDIVAINDVVTSNAVYVELYGQLLLARGFPLNFEIGSMTERAYKGA